MSNVGRQKPAGAAKPFALTVLEDRGIAWSQVHGVPTGARFQAGSISKSVTALVALELAARGVIDLNGEVNGQLRSWQLPDGSGITVRALLGHTGGVGVPFYPGYPHDGAARIPTLREELDGDGGASTRAVRVDPERRGRFRYSGGGYAVIQQLVCDVTGDSFDQTAREAVFEPLGMSHTSFERHPPGPSAGADWHVYPACAAAGMWTTPEDLALFVRALQGTRGHADMTGSVELMLRPHAKLPLNGDWRLLSLFGLRPPDAHGLGMFLHGGHHFSHFGGASGFFSAIIASRHDGTGAVVMTTGDPLLLFRKLRAIGDDGGWTNYRQPVWKALDRHTRTQVSVLAARSRAVTVATGRSLRRVGLHPPSRHLHPEAPPGHGDGIG